METLPDELRPERFRSLREVFAHVVDEHGAQAAYSCLGKTLSYRQVDELSGRFASYLLNETSLEPGDHFAIQLPNLLQFPIALLGAIKAGLVIVSTNPLYTAREMEHQFVDSRVKGIVILNSFCDKLEQIIAKTCITTVIVTGVGDLQSPMQRQLLNFAARYLRKLVPDYSLPSAINFMDCVACTRVLDESTVRQGSGDQVAVILYTGGTTGFAKGAMLSHNNLIANMMQLRSRCLLLLHDQRETLAAPLPLYHSYAFMLHGLTMPFAGNHNLLIPNPRDLDSVIKLLRTCPVSGLVGINTLYLALLRHQDFDRIDFSRIRFCAAGGMPLSTSVAEQWLARTGCEILEGYGLTECAPVVAANQPGAVRRGTVGQLVPETELRVVDQAGEDVVAGERGEAWVRGPQVMLGYWQQQAATREAITADGWFKTGDYVELSEDGFITVVDRKKDMILVSGFNVFPNEIEDWVNRHPGILESAAIGVPDEQTGERIRLFVVCSDCAPEREAIIAHCKAGLTAYKIPREIEYAEDLPKSNVGKILRRRLRH